MYLHGATRSNIGAKYVETNNVNTVYLAINRMHSLTGNHIIQSCANPLIFRIDDFATICRCNGFARYHIILLQYEDVWQ